MGTNHFKYQTQISVNESIILSSVSSSRKNDVPISAASQMGPSTPWVRVWEVVSVSPRMSTYFPAEEDVLFSEGKYSEQSGARGLSTVHSTVQRYKAQSFDELMGFCWKLSQTAAPLQQINFCFDWEVIVMNWSNTNMNSLTPESWIVHSSWHWSPVEAVELCF